MKGFIKLYEDSIIPKRATLYSAGYDLYAHEDVIVKAGDRALVKTGVSCEFPSVYFLGIVPRSGLALKKGIMLANNFGVVDADYFPNEIGVALYNSSKEDFVVKKGERIAQGILISFGIADNEINPTEVRTSGFGSTGKN